MKILQTNFVNIKIQTGSIFVLYIKTKEETFMLK